MERILVIGSGGHARSLIDTLERQNNYQIAGYVVSDKDVAHGTNYPVIGTDDDLDWLFQSGIRNAIIGPFLNNTGKVGMEKQKSYLAISTSTVYN